MQKNKCAILFRVLPIIGLIFSLSLSLSLSLSPVAHATTKLSDRPAVHTFIQHMVHKHHFEAKQLRSWLNQVTIQDSILSAIAKPAEQLPWHRYQPIFISDQRINEGVTFWHQHARALQNAEKKYGISPEIIIAIIGVETFYGKQVGKYKVLDSLATLAFYYPPRSQFFRSELEEFLLLAREEKWDPTQIKGSYAGAMGNPQFVSSSYRHFAVDFTGDGKRDLIHSMDDSIGSVANYFKMHGWQSGGPIAYPATSTGNQFQPIIASKANPKPTHSLEEMSKLGIHIKGIPVKKLGDQPFALVALEGTAGPEYWLGAQNFYVITRYNHSDRYAMAVYTLGERIKDRKQKLSNHSLG